MERKVQRLRIGKRGDEMKKDFIDISDFTGEELKNLLDKAITDKKLFQEGKLPVSCPRKVLALIFEKPSLRTRVSFASAIVQLGGSAIYLTDADIGLGKREPISDVARVLGRMCDAVAARTFSHQAVRDLARFCSKPVINALTDYSHPCQAMADIMTAMEIFGDLAGRKVAFIGDGNNVARSLAMLCVKLGINFVLACPKGYELEDQFVREVSSQGSADCPAGGEHVGAFEQCNDPAEAVKDACVVYTDTWVSMGQEQERQKRIGQFEGFQVNEDLMKLAPKDAVVMHCLPAYRGYEISEGVMEKFADTIFAEAENRLHFQRTLLNVLITKGQVD